ncbi:hypothetical protein HU751_023175 [Pseudomonas sp. BW13M1]|uniref:Uncharacterized protein n=1 Tax=Pseudomonas peradeniyensis TaxID=2745488 RepID=A0A923K0H5_9PSED|nr:hypothetical protein [Pseudomonas peradeniyensis]MBV4507738.1 hypothetical protein [Pseudomonas peradeniyensis]
MTTEATNVQALMKACQRGVAGKGPAIEVANNLLAECYGLLGKLAAENEALRKQVADLSPFKNAPPQDYRASNKCLACGEYHHGLGNLPCPRCTPVAQSAMAKEAQP